jgi:hypothetical protein
MSAPDVRTTAVTHIGNEVDAPWLREMRAYYATNGAYRAEDVQRVLGDPRTVVGVPADRTLFAAALVGRK